VHHASDSAPGEVGTAGYALLSISPAPCMLPAS